jgi:hypothetical protein
MPRAAARGVVIPQQIVTARGAARGCDVAASDFGSRRLSRVGLDNQRDVTERILRHCGMWEGPVRTRASACASSGRSVGNPDEPRELQLVVDPEFL